MLPGEAIPRAPSLHRGGRHQAPRPRLERGDAPARGTRRGSTEGMAPWRHLTTGFNPVGLVRTLAVSASAPNRQNSQRVVTSIAGERGGALPGVEQVVQITWATRAAQAVSGRDRQRSCWWATARRSLATEANATVVRANADRGGSLARRRIHGSRTCPRVEHALQRSAVQSQPREARMNLRRLGAGALHRPPCESRGGQQTGRRGLRSRVNISDGIARCPPGRSRRRSDCRSDPTVNVHGEHPGRKAWVGIGQALGSPSVLPKEDTPDRPLTPSLHGGGATAVLARAMRGAVVCKGGASPRASDRRVRSLVARSYLGEDPGSERAVRPKRATTS